MCDCYVEHCKGCGYAFPVHLGDFATERTEIYVLCDGCWDCLKNDVKQAGFPGWRVFKIEESNDPEDIWGRGMAMVYLTENAWEHRDMNHPNVFMYKIMDEGRSYKSEEKI